MKGYKTRYLFALDVLKQIEAAAPYAGTHESMMTGNESWREHCRAMARVARVAVSTLNEHERWLENNG